MYRIDRLVWLWLGLRICELLDYLLRHSPWLPQWHWWRASWESNSMACCAHTIISVNWSSSLTIFYRWGSTARLHTISIWLWSYRCILDSSNFSTQRVCLHHSLQQRQHFSFSTSKWPHPQRTGFWSYIQYLYDCSLRLWRSYNWSKECYNRQVLTMLQLRTRSSSASVIPLHR